MGIHLDHGVRLNSSPKHRSLYPWALNEVDSLGNILSNDYIPFAWSSPFVGTSCAIRDGVNLHHPITDGEQLIEARYDRSIRIALMPACYDFGGSRPAIFSMFGTDRIIENFTLSIYPIPHEKTGSSYAWAIVSNTYELDFESTHDDDHIGFEMHVDVDAFSRYEAAICSGLIEEIFFTAEGVSGFYTEWSPSISARRVKVLTSSQNHPVELPPSTTITLPRLGDMSGSSLMIRRQFSFTPRSM